ncbi:CBS domain-containing protein [Rhizobium sp. BK068]|uniref:CBS domain-containing protein n=1 Tax=unclassified Rhizobium TaxID=2613769 RepID=UPI0032AFE40D
MLGLYQGDLLIVVSDGRLVGIISRSDLLRAVSQLQQPLPHLSRMPRFRQRSRPS